MERKRERTCEDLISTSPMRGKVGVQVTVQAVQVDRHVDAVDRGNQVSIMRRAPRERKSCRMVNGNSRCSGPARVAPYSARFVRAFVNRHFRLFVAERFLQADSLSDAGFGREGAVPSGEQWSVSCRYLACAVRKAHRCRLRLSPRVFSVAVPSLYASESFTRRRIRRSGGVRTAALAATL